MIARQVMATALFMAVLPAVGVSQQKPITEVPMELLYVEKSTTLERATARATAIVRARIVDSQVRTRMEPGVPYPFVSTAYALNVIEVLKRDPQLPIPTEVLRPGGDLETDRGIRRYVEEGFPAFQPGDEYLLFLYWHDNTATYHMISGADSAYRITPDDRLHGLGRGVLARRYLGRDARDVIGRIREIVAQGPR